MRDGGLTKLFMSKIEQAHFQPVESWSTGQGVPDLNFCIAGIDGWIEMKKTATNSVGITGEQVAWAERRGRNGGRVFLAVRKKHSGGVRLGAPVDQLFLFNSVLHGRDVMVGGLNSAPALYVSPPNTIRAWDWSAVRKILIACT